MFLILTKDNQRYTVESIKNKENGIMFEYNNEMVYLSHSKIKEIDAGFNPVSAKGYVKGRSMR